MPVYSRAVRGPVLLQSRGSPPRSCAMAYRWNLDYVTDTHGNAMAYYYTQDTNYYGGRQRRHQTSPYVRDSHLDHIDYGFTGATRLRHRPGQDRLWSPRCRCFAAACPALSTSDSGNARTN